MGRHGSGSSVGVCGWRRSRDRGVAVVEVIAAGVVWCAGDRGRPGGRAAALCSDIRGGEMLL